MSLVDVTTENERAVYKLTTHKTQEAFVAPMSESYAQTWFRADREDRG